MSDLIDRTRAWIAGDPDPATRSELAGLVQTRDREELADRMNGTLAFGTAGIRGVVEAGSNRMNLATVIRTTAGLAEHLQRTTEPHDRLVVIGRDARPSSDSFMDDTIAVLAAAGFTVRFFAAPTPTPLVAYAGLSLGACASIVITASHNPPRDNGYKVYAANGAQIVSPADTEIAACIAEVGAATDVPRAPNAFETSSVEAIDDEMFEQYLRDVATVLPGVAGDRGISIVYTPMHGVGGRFVTDALRRFGFHKVNPVARQFAPDGTFPTVDFPNPEEPGALDLAHELAQAIDADIVFANDPDTDRLAVSVPDPGGVWRPLTGNQIGCLLAEFLLDHHEGPGVVVNSVVSSPLLSRIADRHAVTYDRTLTGFKWIWNAALDLAGTGAGELVLGYEEALGYSVGTTVRDKDGISAALAFGVLAAEAAADEESVLDRLGTLFERYGVWASAQVSVRVDTPDGSERIARMMDALRSDPPTSLQDLDVSGMTDYAVGADERPRYLGATNLIELDLGDAGRVLARPSGTEPKLKIYVDLTAPYPRSGDWMGAEADLTRRAEAIGEDLRSWLTDAGG
ncbi:MAG: phospho-sugar mutase [Acidimicrobiia bacterium]|nr:phospho-sugar mutase [Acidimicrobiia bacterium]